MATTKPITHLEEEARLKPIVPGQPVTRKSIADIKAPKRQVNASALRFVLRVSDIFWVSILILLSIWNGYIGINNKAIAAPLAAGLLGAIMFAATLMLSGAHRFHPSESYLAHQKKVFFAGFSATGLWLCTALMLKPDTFLPDALAVAGMAAITALFLLHSLYFLQIQRLHERRALAPNIVMLGATDSARRMIEENAKNRELNIVAIFDDRLSRAPASIHGVPVVGKVDDLLAWSDLPYIDRIVVTLPSMAQTRKDQLAHQVRLLPNRIAFVVDQFEDLDHVKQRLSEIAAVSVQDITGKPKSGHHTALKRIMDVVVGTTAMVFGAPILALIALAVKLDSPGPVLFKQKRHGFNNREFYVYKFRSLRVEAEDKNAAQQVTAGDNRITKVGRFIRKTSLDELPQLINVLKGEMSLVGPRPHAIGMRTGNIESYKLVEEYAHRHKVKPGMTGWAQINGSRGPLHDAASVARRVKLDVEYIERSSIWFDVIIMLKTIPCLLGDSENIR
ncbi:MAG: exopolysaccharide biosynthesis polyprenyl glycosylphosphotransferase [Hellea sp.]|nr:exopolysaccharide biosynthesis polyprenyl glycosylphosphotransferase [Hellea sp.]